MNASRAAGLRRCLSRVTQLATMRLPPANGLSSQREPRAKKTLSFCSPLLSTTTCCAAQRSAPLVSPSRNLRDVGTTTRRKTLKQTAQTGLAEQRALFPFPELLRDSAERFPDVCSAAFSQLAHSTLDLYPLEWPHRRPSRKVPAPVPRRA